MNRYEGGCCIARYGGGDNMSKVDRMMLRYRPIAPKPDSGGCSTPPPVESVLSKSRRGKRKHSTEKSSSSGSINSNGNSKRCNNNTRRKGSGSVGGEMVVTLSLLPETPEKKDSPSSSSSQATVSTPTHDLRCQMVTDLRTETVASSLLTVMDGWVEGGEYELGCTDEERKMNLERDTCPGFISDGLGRVIWTNASYRELVVGKEEVSKMSVWLVMKERPLLTYGTFTCRMRLQYTCRGKEVSSVTSPCDVWRMNDGGFAWRLDLNAALCLGR